MRMRHIVICGLSDYNIFPRYLINGMTFQKIKFINHVVCFLFGDSPASECYMPKFRNTLFHLHRQVGACTSTYLPMKMEQTVFERAGYNIQTPGNHPKESIQHSGHSKSLSIILVKCMFFFIFSSTVSEIFLILKKLRQVWYISIHVKYPLFLSDFNKTWIFSTEFRKSSNKISRKSVQWGPSCSIRTDGRTDITKLIVAFHNSAKGPKNCVLSRGYSVLLTILRIKNDYLNTMINWSSLCESCVFSVM